MAGNVLVDAGFLVALLSRRDSHHSWAAAQAPGLALPWTTCESALSEAFHLLGSGGFSALETLIRRDALAIDFDLKANFKPVLALMRKYADVPMSLADACLVRMTELRADSSLLTTDADFKIYRRHGRQVIPCIMPDPTAG